MFLGNRMMNKLYLHLGLHKTGTTSLQETFFPFVCGKQYLKRDTQHEETLYRKIMEFCSFPVMNIDKLELAQADLTLALKHNDVILSEEWLTSDYSGLFRFNGARWQEKLKRLSQLVQGFSYTILIVFRDPIQALPSYYAEFQKDSRNAKEIGSFADFIESNSSRAYDYSTTINVLSKMFNRKWVTVLKYEDLKNHPEIFYQALAEWLSIEPKSVAVGHLHTNRASGSSIEVIQANLSVRLLSRMAAFLPKGVRSRMSFIRSIYHSLQCAISSSVSVKRPGLDECRRIRSRFKSTYQQLGYE